MSGQESAHAIGIERPCEFTAARVVAKDWDAFAVTFLQSCIVIDEYAREFRRTCLCEHGERLVAELAIVALEKGQSHFRGQALEIGSEWLHLGAVGILSLDHVQLAMPPGGEAQARAFYATLLGMPEVAKPAHLAARGGCWFERGKVRVHLGVESDFRPALKAHPAFIVEDLPMLAAALNAAGFATRAGEFLAGYERVDVDDPFGNRIELMEPTGATG